MANIKTHTMTEDDLEEATNEGLFHPECPYCKSKSAEAEPDADETVCLDCEKHFRIINPWF